MSKNKQILVLVKIFKGDVNPFDESALETALSLNGYDVTVLAMAPLSCLDALANLTRLGCEAILLTDTAYALSDTIATSNILSRAIEMLKPELVFAGRKSVDGDTAQVPLMISELTGYELINRVIGENNGVLALRSGEKAKIKDKEIIVFEKFRPLRAPSIFSKKKEIKIMSNADINLPLSRVGQNGSRTTVIKSYQNEEDRRFVTFIDYQELDSVIKKELHKENKEIEIKQNKLEKIHYVGDIEDVASRFTDNPIHLEIENLKIDEAIKAIKDSKAKVIIFEENDKIKELACRIAIKTDTGLCADCTNIRLENGKIVITRPALSGDVMADIICTSPISMLTMRKNKIESDVAITVGKGAIKYIDKINALAKKYNANVYCSRPIADAGLMDYSKQVGLTGRNINPKVCILIGVSGAIQHIVGVNKSKTIIAINIDKKEKVFDYANYGIVMDANNI